MASTLMQQKQVFRKQMYDVLKQISMEQLMSESQNICKSILNLMHSSPLPNNSLSKDFHSSTHICFYLPMKNAREVNIYPILEETLQQFSDKKCFVPIINAKTDKLEMVQVNSFEDLCTNFEKRGKFEILEPKEETISARTNLLHLMQQTITEPISILVICPGTAFTINGKRIGRGKGYYDTFLFSLYESIQKNVNKHFISLKTVGVGFESQIVKDDSAFPSDNTDYQLDYIYQPKFEK